MKNINPIEFFKGHSRFQVESRDESGIERPAEATNIVMMLKEARSKFVQSIPTVALAFMTATGSPSAQAENVEPYAQTDILKVASFAKIAEDGQEDLIPLLSMIDPAYNGSADYIRIRSSVNNPHNLSTPHMLTFFSEFSKKTGCEINMVGMSKILNLVSVNSKYNLDLKISQDLRSIVALHEVAHCEFFFGVTSGLKGHEDQPFYQSWLFLDDIQREIPTIKNMKTELRNILMERQADAKMLLQLAVNSMNSTHGETNDWHSDFERKAELFKLLRAQDKATAKDFNDHDTDSVVKAILQLVDDASSSPEGLAHLKSLTNSSSAMNEASVRMTVGSMMAEMPEIINSLLKEAIKREQKILADTSNPIEKIKSYIKIKEYHKDIETAKEYNYNDNSSNKLSDFEFIENSKLTWGALINKNKSVKEYERDIEVMHRRQ